MENVAYIDKIDLFFSNTTPAGLVQMLNNANAATDAHETETLLRQAVAAWPEGLDAHIALYKFYFRTGQYRAAEQAVWVALKAAARQGGFRWNYRLLTPDSADWLDDHTVSRLYLFSLKALGVIRLRRGRLELAKRVLSKVMDLDPHDEVGAGNFLAIAQSFDDD